MIASTSARSHRSTLVRTTTGSAPQSRARTRERAARSRMSGRVSRSAPSGCTMKITSTFAASTCRSPRFLPRQRSNAVRRGSTRKITPMSCPGVTRTATKSPTPGSSRSPPASAPIVWPVPFFACFPRLPRLPLAKSTACSARRRSPDAVAIMGNPRSRRTTAPSSIWSAGISPAAASSERAASNAETCAPEARRSPKLGICSKTSATLTLRSFPVTPCSSRCCA